MEKNNIEELKEKHKDVINNPAVIAIANWRDPLYHPEPEESEEKYVQRALENLPAYKKLFERTLKLH